MIVTFHSFLHCHSCRGKPLRSPGHKEILFTDLMIWSNLDIIRPYVSTRNWDHHPKSRFPMESLRLMRCFAVQRVNCLSFQAPGVITGIPSSAVGSSSLLPWVQWLRYCCVCLCGHLFFLLRSVLEEWVVILCDFHTFQGLDARFGECDRSQYSSEPRKVNPMQLKCTWNITEPTGKRRQGLWHVHSRLTGADPRLFLTKLGRISGSSPKKT